MPRCFSFLFLTIAIIGSMAACSSSKNGFLKQTTTEGDAILVALYKNSDQRQDIAGSTGDITYRMLMAKPAGKYHLIRIARNNSLKNITVDEIFDITNDNISITDDQAKLLPPDMLPAICNAINTIPTLHYQLSPVIASSDTSTQFYDAIFIERLPCRNSGLLKISNRTSLPVHIGYSAKIPCQPASTHDHILQEIDEEGNIKWFSESNVHTAVDTPKKVVATLPEPASVEEMTDDSFPFPCDKLHNFRLTLRRDKKGEIRSLFVTNLSDKPVRPVRQGFAISQRTVKTDKYLISFLPSVRGAQYDSVLILEKDSAAQTKPDTIFRTGLAGNPPGHSIILHHPDSAVFLQIVPKTQQKNKDSVYITINASPQYEYTYDPLFNAGSFERWLKIHYPGINDLCAGEMAFQVHLRDSNFIKCIYCRGNITDTSKIKSLASPAALQKSASPASESSPASSNSSSSPASQAPSDTTKPAKTNVKKGGGGKVSIIPSAPFIITPDHSVGAKNADIDIPVILRINGKYDSTAASIPFKIKFSNNLSGHIQLLDTIVTISSRSWDSAVRFNKGMVTYNLAALYTNTNDTITRPQQNYIVINDGVEDGRQKIELRNYDPSSSFWMEIGSNFELLNGLTPRNIYAGILLFDKDIAKFSLPWRKDKHLWNISIVAGAYESLTSSTAGSGDSGITYRDNSSYTFNSTQNGYPTYHDTGTVTVTSSTKNIGLFFAPHISLSSTPTDHYGSHVFISLYSELLWQTVTTSNDYSGLHRDSSQIRYVPDSSTLYKYRFKQNSSVTTDYRTTYVGLGVPFYLKRKEFTFYLSDVIGFSNQKFVPVRPNSDPKKLSQVYKYPLDTIPSGYPIAYLQPRCSWNPFYLIQFRFNEERYDISVTGEIRGLFLRNSNPLISLTISKKFDLGTILSSILAPAQPNNTQ